MDLYHFDAFALAPQRKYSPSSKAAANPARMDAILSGVARQHGVTVADLKGPGRARRYAYPRFEAMHALMSVGVWSSLTVGKYLNRDHTTVLYGVNKYEELLAMREAAE